MEKRTITLNELIRLAKTRSGLSQETLRKSLQALLGATSEALDEGKRVSLDNFGSFCVRTIEERTVTPPPPHNTPVIVPKHQIVRFKPSKNIFLYHKNIKFNEEVTNINYPFGCNYDSFMSVF